MICFEYVMHEFGCLHFFMICHDFFIIFLAFYIAFCAYHSSRRDRSVSVPAESAAETETLNHVAKRAYEDIGCTFRYLPNPTIKSA